ncbi:hypothetical protein [Anaeromicropila herbilytica]|uniref:Uncharacterized protein n=1 Tax=Anaeromicropila herbilytica TaxID=2785025 RepID=A0A7R7EPG6_9FIRM|nr:hypothetical protein [Anaeromicropila herbilytica]BCN32604.1 hypothetical protein bsdtb5_38990 [Anaeromicropila herbilytica]
MEIKEFKKWIIDNNFEDNDLFNESLVCYCNRAFKAAYMFSYLAYIEYVRYLVIEYKGIPLQYKLECDLKKSDSSVIEKEKFANEQWQKEINDLKNEDQWDNKLKIIINKDKFNIFCFDKKTRDEFIVKKNHRNVCAHNKQRNITSATVEDLWDFIAYIKTLTVINGTTDFIVSQIKDIISTSNEMEYLDKANEIYLYYISSYGDEKKKLFYKIFELVSIYEFNTTNKFFIYLFELIFKKKDAEEYKWIKENLKNELFVKINVNTYEKSIDKGQFYKEYDKEINSCYSYNSYPSYSLISIFNSSMDSLKKIEFLIEIYNYDNHYNCWNDFLILLNDWGIILENKIMKDAVGLDENINVLFDDIEKLYVYDNGYSKNKKTSTFDYSNFFGERISRKVLFVLWLASVNLLDKEKGKITELIERCKLLIDYTKCYPTNDDFVYMNNVLKRDLNIYAWLSEL